MGAGGIGANVYMGYASYSGSTGQHAGNGEGELLIEPNLIVFGGGGGCCLTQSTIGIMVDGGSGAPGGGGGGLGVHSSEAFYGRAGTGGMLGGGGGAAHYCFGGDGGNAAGGGGSGYGDNSYCGRGGAGLVIIQYRGVF